MARTWLYTLFWLAMWVVVPALALGWTPVTISSGSMEPVVHRGDVLLLEPAEHPLEVGRVATYRTERGLVSHRVVSALDDGTYRTKGDANRTPDSTPISTGQVEGAARIVVPMIGLGPRWLADGELTELALFVLVTLLAVIGAPWRGGRASGPDDVAGRPVGSIGLVLAMTALGVVLPASPASAWSASTDTAGSWAAAVVAAPTNVSATFDCGLLSIGKGIIVEWDAVTDADGYEVHRSTTSGGPYSLIASVDAASTSYKDTNVDNSTTYYYVVRTIAGSWTSEYSAEVSETTPGSTDCLL